MVVMGTIPHVGDLYTYQVGAATAEDVVEVCEKVGWFYYARTSRNLILITAPELDKVSADALSTYPADQDKYFLNGVEFVLLRLSMPRYLGRRESLDYIQEYVQMLVKERERDSA